MSKDIVIPHEKVIKCLNDNIESILEDILTGYDSPIKKMFQNPDSEVMTKIKDYVASVFSEILSDDSFKEKLKDRVLETAIKNMMAR